MASPDLRRRALLPALLATCLAPAAFAASPGKRVVGCMTSDAEAVAQVGKALAQRGYVDGRSVRLEARFHGSDPAGLSRTARELVELRPDAILAFMPFEITALIAVTRTIPVICGPIPDPVAAGFAKSLRRPGGNVTGLSTGSHEIWEFVIGVLRKLRPRLKRILVVHSPGMPVEIQMQAHREAARAAGLEWSHADVSSVADVERVLAPLAGEAIHLAPIVGPPELRDSVLEIAHGQRTLTVGGGRQSLLWYGRHFSDEMQRIAAVLDQVLRGGDPAAIPFELPDRTVLSLNRAVARKVGVEFPPELLMRATQVFDS